MLRRRGWCVLGMNVRYGRDEVDIITLDDGLTLHLIEVRSTTKRTSQRLSISNRKQRCSEY